MIDYLNALDTRLFLAVNDWKTSFFDPVMTS